MSHTLYRNNDLVNEVYTIESREGDQMYRCRLGFQHSQPQVLFKINAPSNNEVHVKNQHNPLYKEYLARLEKDKEKGTKTTASWLSQEVESLVTANTWRRRFSTGDVGRIHNLASDVFLAASTDIALNFFDKPWPRHVLHHATSRRSVTRAVCSVVFFVGTSNTHRHL